MTEVERVAAALQEYGTVERTDVVADGICYVDGVWYIPLEKGHRLRVEHASLPHAVAELLALYAGGVAGAGGTDVRQLVSAWLSGERESDGATLANWLHELGWGNVQGAIVLLEFARPPEPGAAEEATSLLQELIEPNHAVVAAQGRRRVVVLVPLEVKMDEHGEPAMTVARKSAHARHSHGRDAHGRDAYGRDAYGRDAYGRDAFGRDAYGRDAHGRDAHGMDVHGGFCSMAELRDAVSAWIDTLGAELFLLCRAGVSGTHGVDELRLAREEAEFALEAGKLLLGKDAVHAYERLGIARLLYGAPEAVRREFVAEILPAEVLEVMTHELSETATAFVEHGQQVADTARALFVHRNTLLYRLERIHELTGCDPRHPLDGWTLWLALLLHRSGCTSQR